MHHACLDVKNTIYSILEAPVLTLDQTVASTRGKQNEATSSRGDSRQSPQPHAELKLKVKVKQPQGEEEKAASQSELQAFSHPLRTIDLTF